LTETTVLIKTLGRHTLRNAIASAKREKFKVIVVSDGCRTSSMGANKFVKLGRKWGYYGGMATNVGAAMAETEFITLLDDDDEFIPGAGDIIRSKLYTALQEILTTPSLTAFFKMSEDPTIPE